MDNLSMGEVLTMFDTVCEAFARMFSPDLSDEAINLVQHDTSIALFESTALVTEQSPDTLYQAMKNLLDIERGE